MASTINAKTTGVGGIDASGDASGVLALQTGGTTAVTIDASQNVGIGTSTPGTKLQIAGNIALQGSTSGTVTLQAPAVSGSTVLTLPAVSGTVITNTAGVVTQAMLSTNVAGNGPAFSAYPSGAGQSVINNTNVKLAFNTEFFDTNSNFDAVTNYRFTPTVTGYYQVNLCGLLSAATGIVQVAIYRNGAQYLVGITNNNTNGVIASASTIIYFNGSTDYIEGYIYQTSGGTLTTLANRSDLYQFSAFLARSA